MSLIDIQIVALRVIAGVETSDLVKSEVVSALEKKLKDDPPGGHGRSIPENLGDEVRNEIIPACPPEDYVPFGDNDAANVIEGTLSDLCLEIDSKKWSLS